LIPARGANFGRFDPRIDDSPISAIRKASNAAAWPYGKDAAGRGRIYLATADRRLIALDAATGKPVEGFGVAWHRNGSVPASWSGRARMQFTSMPLVKPRCGDHRFDLR